MFDKGGGFSQADLNHWPPSCSSISCTNPGSQSFDHALQAPGQQHPGYVRPWNCHAHSMSQQLLKHWHWHHALGLLVVFVLLLECSHASGTSSTFDSWSLLRSPLVLNQYSLESESVPGNAVNVIFDTPEQRQDIWTYVFQLALTKSCTGCGTVSLSQYIDLAKLRDIWSQLTISWEYCCIPVCPRLYLLPLTNQGLPSICCSHW